MVSPSIDNFGKSELNDKVPKNLDEHGLSKFSKTECHSIVITNQSPSITNKKNIEQVKDVKIVRYSKLINSDTKKKVVEFKKSMRGSENSEVSGLKVVGWIVTVIGLLILLFASILIGILLMLLGLVFIISGGGGKSDEEKKSNNPQYIDVVYLKNGSVIKGIIIEQIPNEKLKIQTKDGSVFVYKMEEVAKIAKELADSK